MEEDIEKRIYMNLFFDDLPVMICKLCKEEKPVILMEAGFPRQYNCKKCLQNLMEKRTIDVSIYG